MKTLIIFLLLVITPFLQGCKEKSFARVNCTNVEKFESGSGVLNVGLQKLGDIIILNKKSKIGNYFLSIPLQQSDFTVPDVPIDTLEVLTNTSFEIQLAGDISKDPDILNLKIETQNTISKNTMFFLKNC